jgi:hypothetical protein
MIVMPREGVNSVDLCIVKQNAMHIAMGQQVLNEQLGHGVIVGRIVNSGAQLSGIGAKWPKVHVASMPVGVVRRHGGSIM